MTRRMCLAVVVTVLALVVDVAAVFQQPTTPNGLTLLVIIVSVWAVALLGDAIARLP
jgi:hypothetical protein